MGLATGVKPAKAPAPALCVDLDGTVIRGDLLWECVLALLKSRPFTLLLLPIWMLRGTAHPKRQLATTTRMSPARLPYRAEVLELIRKERKVGRTIALVTAAERELAESIARYLDLFDEVHASDGVVSLIGAHRGELKKDPVTLAIPDRVSYGVAFASALVIAASMVHVSF